MRHGLNLSKLENHKDIVIHVGKIIHRNLRLAIKQVDKSIDCAKKSYLNKVANRKNHQKNSVPNICPSIFNDHYCSTSERLTNHKPLSLQGNSQQRIIIRYRLYYR